MEIRLLSSWACPIYKRAAVKTAALSWASSAATLGVSLGVGMSVPGCDNSPLHTLQWQEKLKSFRSLLNISSLTPWAQRCSSAHSARLCFLFPRGRKQREMLAGTWEMNIKTFCFFFPLPGSQFLEITKKGNFTKTQLFDNLHRCAWYRSSVQPPPTPQTYLQQEAFPLSRKQLANCLY